MLCPNDVTAPLQSAPPFPPTIEFFINVTVPISTRIPPAPAAATFPLTVLFVRISDVGPKLVSSLTPAPPVAEVLPLIVAFVSDALPWARYTPPPLIRPDRAPTPTAVLPLTVLSIRVSSIEL